MSPKRYIRNRIIEKAKPLLGSGASSLDTALRVGLSGPGRLHDLFISIEAITSGEYKSRGQSLAGLDKKQRLLDAE
jgi:AraC family transcriptional regulator of adaptative response/methylated-DNA-[protein]-cysteine methyltransferase